MILICWQGCAALSRSPKLDPNARPHAVFLQIAENYRGLNTYRGRGRMIVDTPENKFDAPVTVLVRKPDSLFIKVEAVFGIDVGFLFADGKRFESYSPQENVYYFGDIDQMQQLLVFQMEVTYEEMMSGIVGTILPPFDSTFTMTIDDGKYRFEGKRDDWRLSYWVDPKRSAVTKAEQRDSTGALYARQTFRRFRKNRGIWLPQLIQIDKPSHRERLNVFYNRVEVNKKVAAKDFHVPVPSSAERINLSKPPPVNGQIGHPPDQSENRKNE